MRRNRILDDIRTERRERIARLRVKGLSYREIAEELTRLPEPITALSGRPLDVAVIKRDMDAIRREWHKRYAVTIDKHIARQMAEINELKRQAWDRRDMDMVLKCIALEMKLIGSDAPQKIEDWTNKDWRDYARENGISESDVIKEAERIAAEYSGRSISAPTGESSIG